MKYKSKSIGDGKSLGLSFDGVEELTVPNQSMSLEEILQRFVRKEKLPIGKDVQYHETDYDLEKLSRMDLTERDEFIAAQKEVQARYDRQKKAAALAKAEKEAALLAASKLPPVGGGQS